jgi:Tol biopolymer transport system component
MSLAAGARLGPYEIVALLGAGGMGEVYRARDPKLNRDVALKILPEGFAADPDRLARFKREAQVLASLNHPNIAGIYGFEDADATHALVLELVEGETLDSRLRARDPASPGARRRALTIDEALAIARQIADALEAAHARGIVHRDLKPANIKITSDGRVKVLDFGLAKTAAADITASDAAETSTATFARTAHGVILGTAAYMSPEQARGLPIDKRTDIWAFGCVVYEMLVGSRPFGGATVADVLAAILEREPSWDRLPNATPPMVVRMLQRCLEKDLNRRLRDVADARLEIDETLPDARVRGWRPKSPTRLVLRVAAPTAVVALVAWFAAQQLRRPPPPAPITVKVAVPGGSATADPGRLLGPPAVSPDGRAIVVSLSTGATPNLFVRPLESDKLTPLDGTAGAAYPFWSPDSRTIAFFADGKLKSVAAGGGTPTVVCEAGSAVMAGGATNHQERGGAWSADGTIIFAINFHGIFECNRQTQQPTEITKLDTAAGENSDRYPVFLPDGRRFLYYARTNDLEKRAIYLDSLDGRTQRRRVAIADGQFVIARNAWADGYYLLTQQAGRIFTQAFDVRSGALVGDPQQILDRAGQVTASDSGVLVLRPEAQDRARLAWFDRTGRETSVMDAPTDYWQVALSPDDRRVAAVKHDYLSGAFTVWTATADGSQLEPFSHAARVMSPVWSPDSKALFYAGFATESRRNGQILLRSIDTNAPEQITETTEGTFHARDASGPAHAIVAEQSDATGRKITIAWRPLDGGDWKPFGGEGTREEQPHFSPDGKWLAYSSDRSGSVEVYVGAFPSGPTFHVSRGGGREPHWRGDGKELFYLTGDSWLASVDVARGFDNVAVKQLFRPAVRRGSEGPLFAVTRDGQRFLLIVGEYTESPDTIDVVLNWPGLMRR